MVARQPNNFQRRINSFVPGMAYAVDVIENGPVRFSLGTPVVSNDAGILNDTDIAAASSTTTLLVTEVGGTYGRNLRVTKPTGGATGTVTVSGRDYLGQPMKEAFTTVASTSTVVEGKKAFKYVDEVVWTAHAGSTLDLGWGNKLGLPYTMEDFVGAYENGVKMERNKDQVAVRISNTLISSASTVTGRSPVRGNIVGLRAVVTTIITTADNNETINVNGGSAITGLALVLPFTASAVGDTKQKSVANGTANCAVVPGDVINVISDGGGDAGAAEFDVIIQPEAGVYTEAVYTDPQTTTTGDPRGLYEAFNTLDGAKEIEVVYNANRDLNAAGRGGLHGMAHFFA
jgi:hypothetical protein